MNIFQLTYEDRLKSWHELKKICRQSDLETKCVLIDDWWQKAPTVNHYLHIYDIHNWPDPWELLVENLYCDVAKALGMYYTLYIIGERDIELVEATDQFGNDVVLVLVNSAKYILNYWPSTVLNNQSQDFTIKRSINLSTLLEKI